MLNEWKFSLELFGVGASLPRSTLVLRLCDYFQDLVQYFRLALVFFSALPKFERLGLDDFFDVIETISTQSWWAWISLW